jgi:hypothetical protein
MGFSIDIDDSELKRTLEELQNAIAAETLLEWANAIEGTIHQTCNEHIKFKGEIANGEFHIDFTPMTSDDIDCVIRAIQEHLSSMHPATQKFYEQVIESFQSQRAKM